MRRARLGGSFTNFFGRSRVALFKVPSEVTPPNSSKFWMRPAQRFPFVKWCLSPPLAAVPSPPQHRTSARSHFRAAARRSQADGDDFESLGFDDAAFAALETDFENVRPPPAAPGALAWASVDAQVCTEPPPLLRPFRRFFKSSAPTRSSSASASSTRRCTVRSRSRTNRRSGW